MFCENCGKKIPEGAVFCVNCGTKIQLPKKMETNSTDFTKSMPDAVQGRQMKSEGTVQPEKGMQPKRVIQQRAAQEGMQAYSGNRVQQTVQRQPKKPMSIFSKIILAEFVIAAVLGILFTMKVKEYVSPEYVAKQYFAAVMSGDGKRAYRMVQVEGDDFINEEQFQNVVENMSHEKVSNFQIKEKEKNKDSYTHYIEIDYRLKEDTNDYNMLLTLEKSKEKKWMLFDDWKVNVGNYIVRDISIEAKKGSKITIDGKELSNDQISKQQNEAGNMVYTIPRMFQGEYRVVITNDMYEDIVFEMNIDKEEEQYYSRTGTILKKETVEKVMETAKTDFKTLWESAGEKKSFSEVKMQSITTGNSEVQNEYENVVSQIADKDTTGIKNLNFGEFQVTAQQMENYDFDEPCIKVQFVSDVAYTAVTSNWWTGDLEENQDSTNGYTANLSYVYQDDGWKLYDADMDL